MNLLDSIPKNIQIFFILAPFFLSILLLAYLTNKTIKKAQKYPFYWLLTTIILSVIYVVNFFSEEVSYTKLLLTGIIASLSYSTYLTLKKK